MTQQIEKPVCKTCNGERMVGGWSGGTASIDGGGSYENHPCPDCVLPTHDQLSALCAQMAAALEELRDAVKITEDVSGKAVAYLMNANTALTAYRTMSPNPINMVLHCPNCGKQHVDEPDERTPDWHNPPHRSHLCHGCGHIWRPADVATNGVSAIKTVGKADSPKVSPDPQWQRVPEGCVVVPKKLTPEIAEALRFNEVSGTGRWVDLLQPQWDTILNRARGEG